MSLSLYDLFVSMGPFAKFIVIVLAVMSIFSWAGAFQKWWQLYRSQKETMRFAPEFSRFLQEEQLDGAIKLAEKQKRSHVARVVGEALSEVKTLLRDRATITAADINVVERAVEREMLIVAAEVNHDLVRSDRRDPCRVAVQLLLDQDRLLVGRDDLHVQGADRLPDQERRLGVRPLDLHQGVPDAEGDVVQWPYQSLAPAPNPPSRRTSTSRR